MKSPQQTSAGLIDRIGRRVTYLRLSVTDRCNFRCRYCYTEDSPKLACSTSLLSFEEMARIASILARHGVTRIRLTGGEPLVRRHLDKLIGMLHAIDGIDEVVMTTNAYLLAGRAEALAEAGLRAITVSLDTLDPTRFTDITRGGQLAPVLEGITAAQSEGMRVKVNTVVLPGFNDDEVVGLAQWGIDNGVLVRFIEFMPVGDTALWSKYRKFKPLLAEDIRRLLGAAFELHPLGRKASAGPAFYWELDESGAQVGIISALGESFCAGCNRIRVTPQGGLRACLADDDEISLRDAMRAGATDQDVLSIVQRSLDSKRDGHTFVPGGAHVTNTPMVAIGG